MADMRSKEDQELQTPISLQFYTFFDTGEKGCSEKRGNVVVSSRDLQNVVKEMIKFKETLRKVLCVDNIGFLFKKIRLLEQDIHDLRSELCQKHNEMQFQSNRCDTLMQEIEKYREENFQLKNMLNIVEEERAEEYDSCLSFITSCVSLLWRVSLNDDSVTNMLSWKTMERFMNLVATSLAGFLDSNKQEVQVFQPDSEEINLVLAIGGVLTNIAATALGREYLVTKQCGVHVLDYLVLFLTDLPQSQCVQVKSLILKMLYNISINAKGLKYLVSKKGFMRTLGSLLQEETDVEVRLYLVKCIQSLVIEPDCLAQVHEVLEMVSLPKLQSLAEQTKGELQKCILELVSDVTVAIQGQA